MLRPGASAPGGALGSGGGRPAYGGASQSSGASAAGGVGPIPGDARGASAYDGAGGGKGGGGKGAQGDPYAGRYAAPGPTPEQYAEAKATRKQAQQQFALRTAFGPVPFRPKRDPVQMVVSGGQETVTIRKHWLKTADGKEPSSQYHRAVKQAMLVAAERIKVFDSEDPNSKVTPAQAEMAKARQAKLLRGHERIEVTGAKKKSLHKVESLEKSQRDTLIKFSNSGCVAGCTAGLRRRERAFIINENMEMLVYKYKTQDSKLKDSIKLKDARCWHETRDSQTVPAWEGAFQERLRVDVPERQEANKNPLYLYADDPMKIQRWKRAFRMARVLVVENDRRAMRVSVNRANAHGLHKAWEALVRYFEEVASTQDTVKQMGMRLFQVDLSRGWTKLKLVHKKRGEEQRRRAEQQVWAARFMFERLAKLGSTNARSSSEVRESVITSIQQRFRRYRQDTIYDKRYPLTAGMVSRIQEAKLGKLVDFEMLAVRTDVAVRLSLTGRALERWEQDRDYLRGAKPTYSDEADEALSTVTLYVSDNLTSLSFASRGDEGSGYGAIAKASWSKYINLDRISSIVLHSQPPVTSGASGLEDGGRNVSWLTINGPRLAWDKREDIDEHGNSKIVGASDGFNVPANLARHVAVQWVTIALSNVSASLHLRPDEDESCVESFIRVHFLGYSFKSLEAKGSAPTYKFASQGELLASVPVESDACVALDKSCVVVEVFQVHAADTDQARSPDDTCEQRYVGKRTLHDIFGGSIAAHAPLTASISLGAAPYGGKFDHGSCKMTLEVRGSKEVVAPSMRSSTQLVSPELGGGGVVTSVFTSHRQAWYDPDLGPGKFRVDHIPNFVELNLGTLRLPEKKGDKKAGGAAHGQKIYRIRATSLGCGITQDSVGLHRPTAAWAKVIGATYGDEMAIRFSGCKLFLPIAPGSWGSEDAIAGRRKIELAVVESDPEFDYRPVNYAEFFEPSKQDPFPAQQDPKRLDKRQQETAIYKAVLSFDSQLMVDRVKNLSVSFEKVKPGTPITAELNVQANAMTSGDFSGDVSEECLLTVDFALRDRDYIKGALGEAGNRRALCVGDKATLTVMEPLIYPKDEREFKKRFAPGDWSSDHQKHNVWQSEGCKLREPCLSSEYAESGLGDIVPKVWFTQKFIPTFCENVIPHRFVLPVSEKQHLDRALPGFYPLIIDDLVDGPDARHASRAAAAATRAGLAKPIVSHLKAVNAKVPVVVLAVYADATCDVEVDAKFVERWSRQSDIRYAMPGYLETAGAPAAANPAQIRRAVLKRVPTSSLRAVHYTGINIYDSQFKSTQDVLAAEAPKVDLDPTAANADKFGRTGDRFIVAAGPMPPDASSSACLYEWTVHVRSPSEADMYQLAAMLRRCHRMDHYQQALKIKAFLSKVADGPVIPQQYVQRPLTEGQLDVVLVEARRLLPKQGGIVSRVANSNLATMTYDSLMNPKVPPVRTDAPVDETYLPTLMGTTDGEPSSSTPVGTKASFFVNFRMLQNFGEVLPYRGQKVQQSAILSGSDSPNWSVVEQLRQSGGWTFRTGMIDLGKHQKLTIELDVRLASMGFSTKVGSTQLPVTTREFLTNKDEPFRNLWLPLFSITPEGNVIANPTGEIHIMTRWLPAEMMQIMADGSRKQQLSVRSTFLKELWPRICAQRLKEPIYGLECQYLRYDPNLVRDREGKSRTPEAPKEFIRRHAEQLANTVPYVECLELRQTQAWKEFEELIDAEQPGLRLAERRLRWMESENTEQLQRFAQLIERGIPSGMRERLWPELTLASRVLEKDGVGAGAGRTEVGEAAVRAAEKDYQRFLERGLAMTSDATKQLVEDGAGLAAWETTTPPQPEVLAAHLNRIRRAQNVITALLAVPGSGFAYCEGALVLAFFMLLPQACREERVPSEGASRDFKESTVFWMLYTLICSRTNGAYNEYYGVPPSAGMEDTLQPPMSLVSGSGAMQDVSLLECCLAYHEKDLWEKMSQLGFTLATVFYGAFMRLYATYMPTATVFRFWDILFAQSTDPKPQFIARSHLVDLAFGLIRSRRADICECCSAGEVKSLLLGALGSLYDTCTVVDITMLSHRFLWAGGGFASGKICAMWTQRDELFKVPNTTAAEQNDVLKQLTHMSTLRTGSAGSQAGVSTEDVLREVMPAMTQSFQNLKRGEMETWGMFRPMPLATHVICEGFFEKYWQQLRQSIRTAPALPPNPFRVAQLPEEASKQAGLEPRDISTGDLSNVLERENVLRAWAPHATALWNAFTNRRDRLQLMGTGYDMSDDMTAPFATSVDGMPLQRPTVFQTVMQKFFTPGDPVQRQYGGGPLGSSKSKKENADGEQFSLNELFTALICASRGTIAEKANALFNIYAYNEQRASQETNHITPVTRAARSVASAATESASESLGRTLAPPDPASVEALNNCLRLEIWAEWPQAMKLGDVFISSLSPYVNFSRDMDPAPITYNIWGKPPGHRGMKTTRGGMETVCLGEVVMSITWTPANMRKAEEGQLCIHVRHIRFFGMYVSDFYKINPWIEVSMSVELPPGQLSKVHRDCTRDWVPIKRWDPRSLIGTSQQRSKLTTHGSYGGTIKFEKTMMASVFGKGEGFHSYLRDSQGMGYNKKEAIWEWNEIWGKQLSETNLKVLPEFVKLSSRRNCMDIQGARLIVSVILQQCMLQMTNRQACLIADATFNRMGVVPGILKAIVVPGSDIRARSMAEIERDSADTFKDVTHEICLEQEHQITRNGCTLNLFSRCWLGMGTQEYAPYGFEDMGMKDHFPGREKVLWIRFVRGGDGERQTWPVKFDRDGKLVGPDNGYEPEVPMEQQNMWPQTKITREEFISCFMASPILSESLRRLGSSDHVLHAKKAISLEVAVVDPHHEEEDDQLLDAIDVQQSILLEVWDSDTISKDFLGEAWLPPLSQFTTHAKDLVLPLQKADFSDDAENGASRPDAKKDLGDDKDPNKKITGDLFVSVSWKYPLFTDLSQITDLGQWLQDLHIADKVLASGPYQGKTRTEAIRENWGDLRSLSRDVVAADGTLDKKFSTQILPGWDKAELSSLNKFFKEHGEGEDTNARANVQEKLHTGALTIKITQARFLRRSDAKKMRDCDPSVHVWIRNDHQMAWRKKPIYRTKTISNNRNPTWDVTFTKEILTGAYEARYKLPEEGWLAEVKRATMTSKQKRYIEEDRAAAMVKRFGKDGLRIKFSDSLPPMAPMSQQIAQQPGENHRVEVLISDSIHDFKSKLTSALAEEAKFWRAKGDDEKAANYADIRIGHKHLVMAFVPSQKVQKLRAQKLAEGEEYRRAHRQAVDDPSNWQPLDPARSFSQYAQFNFGRASAPPLRVVEASEAYKAQNLRYKVFDEEMSKRGWADLNDKKRCFGWARYSHKEDASSSEWRPAVVSRRADEVALPPSEKPYLARWVFEPSVQVSSGTSVKEQTAEPADVDRSDVLLAPRIPKFEDTVDKEHEDLLEQATMLRASGKSDWEIEAVLNKLLSDKFEEQRRADPMIRQPAAITVDEVRTYLQRKAVRDAEKA